MQAMVYVQGAQCGWADGGVVCQQVQKDGRVKPAAEANEHRRGTGVYRWRGALHAHVQALQHLPKDDDQCRQPTGCDQQGQYPVLADAFMERRTMK